MLTQNHWKPLAVITCLAATIGPSAVLALMSPPDLNIFPPGNPWNTPVDTLPADPESDTVITWLTNNGGWGAGNSLRIDFSINVLTSDAATDALQSFNPTGDFYSPDCDASPFPVPAGGAIEGETGYQCTSDGDCHLLVVDASRQTLFEMWRANVLNGVFNGGCSVLWDLTGVYGNSGRGDGCTSADAGGFPITTMLFSADEVAAGAINHAIRFILPNNRIRKMVYAHPASHSTAATSGDATAAPPYGVRLRLKSTTDLTQLSPGAQVIARALQTYGMLLADGGNIALTAASDTFTQAKWTDVGVDSFSLTSLKTTDFEVVGMSGNLVASTNDCNRVGPVAHGVPGQPGGNTASGSSTTATVAGSEGSMSASMLNVSSAAAAGSPSGTLSKFGSTAANSGTATSSVTAAAGTISAATPPASSKSSGTTTASMSPIGMWMFTSALLYRIFLLN